MPELTYAPDREDWTPDGYQEPTDDAPQDTREHPHPLDDDQPKEG